MVRTVPAQGAIPRLAITEELRIDGVAEDFSVVGSVSVSAKGTIAIVFGQDASVRLYSATGQRIGAVGRRGNGPGEFRWLTLGPWLGDSVWVLDYALYRETMLSADARVLRVSPLPAALNTPPEIAPQPGSVVGVFTPRARFLDGTALGLTLLAGSAPGLPSVRVVARASARGELEVVATIPAADARWQEPFRFRPLVEFSPDGMVFAHVQVNDLAVRGGSFSVASFSARGTPLGRVSLPYSGVRMTARAADSVARARGPSDPDGLGRQFGSPQRGQRPPVFAPVQRMLIGRDHRAWVTVMQSATQSVAYAITPQGVPTGVVTLPPRARLVSADSSHLWMVQRDADGVDSIVRYRLRRP